MKIRNKVNDKFAAFELKNLTTSKAISGRKKSSFRRFLNKWSKVILVISVVLFLIILVVLVTFFSLNSTTSSPTALNNQNKTTSKR
jgi:hypothetical protein